MSTDGHYDLLYLINLQPAAQNETLTSDFMS